MSTNENDNSDNDKEHPNPPAPPPDNPTRARSDPIARAVLLLGEAKAKRDARPRDRHSQPGAVPSGTRTSTTAANKTTTTTSKSRSTHHFREKRIKHEANHTNTTRSTHHFREKGINLGVPGGAVAVDGDYSSTATSTTTTKTTIGRSSTYHHGGVLAASSACIITSRSITTKEVDVDDWMESDIYVEDVDQELASMRGNDRDRVMEEALGEDPPTIPPGGPSARSLVVANLVRDRDHDNDDDSSVPLSLPKAHEWDPAQAQRESQVKQKQALRTFAAWVVVGIIVMVVVMVVVVVILVLAKKEEDNGSDENNNVPVELSSQDLLLSLLPKNTVKYLVEDDPDSPQVRALRWMMEDPVDIQSRPHWRLVQRFALVTFFYAMGGAGADPSSSGWIESTNWLSYAHHECDWFSQNNSGIFYDPSAVDWLLYETLGDVEGPCRGERNELVPNPETEQYQHLWLHNNGLKGSRLPEELYLLTSLLSIGLDSNNIGGPISSSVGNFRSLEALSISSNDLTGTLPRELFTLTNLTNLHLIGGEQKLHGPIPTEVAYLTALQYLELDQNQLSGSIPSELGTLGDLRWLILSGNHLSGPIPATLGYLPKLDELFVMSNLFTGCIPSTLGLLTKLLRLYLEDLFLSCTLPSELGGLQSLLNLHIRQNHMEGTIPTEFGLLTNLGDPNKIWHDHEVSEQFGLSLEKNTLTGPLPTELASLQVRFLGLHFNQLSGTLPTELGLLPRVDSVRLDSNRFTGSIPSELGQWSDTIWRWLNLNDNQFSGRIPSELGLFWYLGYIYLSNNSLTGSIPTELGSDQLPHLQELYLGSNQLSGGLPKFSDKLVKLHVGENVLSGSGFLPLQTNWAVLEYWNVSYNNFTGSVSTASNTTGNRTVELKIDISGNPGITGILPSYGGFCPYLLFDCSMMLCGCDWDTDAYGGGCPCSGA